MVMEVHRDGGSSSERMKQLADAVRHHAAAEELQDRFGHTGEAEAAAHRGYMSATQLEKLRRELDAADQAPLPRSPEELVEDYLRLRRTVASLRIALETNRRIGAAIGILMAAHKISTEQAFDLLRRASQNGHRKLGDVAEEVLLTGALPET